MAWLTLLEMSLLRMVHIVLLRLLGIDCVLLGGIHIFLAEQTLDFCGNFVMDNCLIIFSFSKNWYQGLITFWVPLQLIGTLGLLVMAKELIYRWYLDA